jgi:endonuclease/exonuclease/phosphatase family metal-dependent hydrolase
MKDGVEIDVLVTHMNTADGDAQIAAQNGQLTEVATYINKIRSNNRPIIFMGDMNTRYTRNDYQTYFWGVLDDDLTCADPWVEHSWNGVYPTLGSASLMVPSKDTSSTLTEQTGEVVDKIIYINNPNSPTQIKSNWYNHDEAYTGMADHKPVTAEFTYTHTIKQ